MAPAPPPPGTRAQGAGRAVAALLLAPLAVPFLLAATGGTGPASAGAPLLGLLDALGGPLGALLLVGAGLLAGLSAGLFGIGGGLVMVPVLHYLAGRPWDESVAASLLVIAVNTPFGLRDQARRGNLLAGTGLLLAAGGLLGVVAAHRAAPHVPEAWLKVAFAAILAFAAWRLARRAPAASGVHPASTWLLLPAGIAAGLAARLLGIGGGLLMVPVMVLSGIPIHHAVATSLIAVETNALFSTLVNLASVPPLLGLALPFAVGAVPGIRLGVAAANALTARRLLLAFALALVGVALYMAWDGASRLA